MTISSFARLCGCKTQTLRCYDHMGLLKPGRVDPWTGYRHYDEEQAVAFVKIKNLQQAGFKIDEIRSLLEKTNAEIIEAFDQKIAEQTEKLKKIQQIRRSYQSEMSEIKQKIQEISENVDLAMRAYDPGEEFGIDDDAYKAIMDEVAEFFNGLATTESDSMEYAVDPDGDDTAEGMMQAIIHNPHYEILYERHGWQYVREFYDRLETPRDGEEYVLCFAVTKEKENRTAFSNTVLGIIIGKNIGDRKETSQYLRCRVTLSEDGQNHFWLLGRRKRENL